MKSKFHKLKQVGILHIQKMKILFIGISGIISGLGLIRYIEATTSYNLPDSKYATMIWLMIPLSSLTWTLFRLFLSKSNTTILSVVVFISVLSYWLYSEDSRLVIMDIFLKEDNRIAPFVVAGILIASMSFIDYFLFSHQTVKFVTLVLFDILFSVLIIPTLFPVVATKVQAFLMSLTFALILAGGWIVCSELLILIATEILGIGWENAEKQ